MKRGIVFLLLHASLLTLGLHAQTRQDSVPQVEGDTLREVIITKDRRLPIFHKEQEVMPRQKSVSDIIGRKATDMIMHPFAFAQRKQEKKRRKAMKKLWEYDQIKTDEELIRAALLKEGIDPDSLLQQKVKGKK